MIDHFQMWHDGANGRRMMMENSKGLVVITAKLDKLGREINNVHEKFHAVQVVCEIYDGFHLSKDCQLKYDVSKEEAKYGKFYARHFLGNTSRYKQGAPGYYTREENRPSGGKRRGRNPEEVYVASIKNLKNQVNQIAQAVLGKFDGASTSNPGTAQVNQVVGKKKSTPYDLSLVNSYAKPYVPSFLVCQTTLLRE
ncbi:hypothetical protein Tco_0993535 [Tanacetum coccineum]